MENNQSVCYVGKINEIKEIPGCDNIMSAKINDWNTIVIKRVLGIIKNGCRIS